MNAWDADERYRQRLPGSRCRHGRRLLRPDRMQVWLASGGWCHLCGFPIQFPDVDRHELAGLSFDHVHPRSRGGSNEGSNLAVAHRFCNKLRGARKLTAALRYEIAERAATLFEGLGDETRDEEQSE